MGTSGASLSTWSHDGGGDSGARRNSRDRSHDGQAQSDHHSQNRPARHDRSGSGGVSQAAQQGTGHFNRRSPRKKGRQYRSQTEPHPAGSESAPGGGPDPTRRRNRRHQDYSFATTPSFTASSSIPTATSPFRNTSAPTGCSPSCTPKCPKNWAAAVSALH